MLCEGLPDKAHQEDEEYNRMLVPATHNLESACPNFFFATCYFKGAEHWLNLFDAAWSV